MPNRLNLFKNYWPVHRVPLHFLTYCTLYLFTLSILSLRPMALSLIDRKECLGENQVRQHQKHTVVLRNGTPISWLRCIGNWSKTGGMAFNWKKVEKVLGGTEICS